MLQQSNALNSENVIFQMPGICFWKNIHSEYCGGNKEMLESNGFSTLEDILGKTDFDLSPFNQDAAKYTEQDKYTLMGNIQFNVATPTQKDGTLGVHLIKKGPLLNNRNEIVGVVGLGFNLNPENYSNLISRLAMASLKLSDFTKTISEKDPEFIYGNIGFTKRQAQVISCLLKGYSADLTAKTLNLSRRTVEHYLDIVKDKLNCQNKLQIVSKAFEMGFIHLMFLNIT
jgi:DNA-binding CsgD family transcriptional regulator